MENINLKHKANIKNSFCAQPWVGLQVASDKAIRPCCMFDEELGYYSDQSSLDAAFNSILNQDVRSHMLEGRWHKNCLGCKREEELTGTSPRIFSPGLTKSLHEHEAQRSFQKVELFFDNLCNLDCVMCRPAFSSKWNRHVENLNSRQINFNHFRTENHTQLSKGDVEKLFDQCQFARQIILIGGEPFASAQCLYFLDLWSKSNSDALLQITTNATLLNDRILDILSTCKNVFLQASIDATGDLYEWIRGFSWITVEQNLMRAKKRGIKIQLSPTLGVFNIFHLNQLNDFAVRLSAGINFGHVLRQPDYLSALNLPLQVRKKVIENLPPIKEQDISVLKQFLSIEEPQSYAQNRKKLKAWVDYFDSIRGKALSSISFELYEYLNQLNDQ